MVPKYGHLMSPGAFPDTIAPDTGFIDEVVVNCDVSVVKIHLQVVAVYKQLQVKFDVNTYVLSLDPVLCIVLVS